MRKIFLSIMLLVCCWLNGCASLANPKVTEHVDNTGGQIDEIKNNQNGLAVELGKVRQDQHVTAEKVNGLQQGLVNQSNAGIQILQGSGGLVLVFGLVTVFMVLHYRGRAVKGEKAADIMAKEIATSDDAMLQSRVLKAAENTKVEGNVYGLIHKYSKPVAQGLS